MSVIGSGFASMPGMGTLVEEWVRQWMWGPFPRYFRQAQIDSGAADSGNSPTYDLRPGLVLGVKFSSGTFFQYSPTATDGTEIAAAVLMEGIRLQDVLSGSNKNRLWGVCLSGGVKASGLIGLDGLARSQMNDRFTFDDNYRGNHWFPFQRFQTKTADYTITALDNGSHFDNTGATGTVNFTLPAIANGYAFGFHAVADQILKVISAEGTNVVALNNASATSVAVQTGSQKIGGGFFIFSNAAGTKWLVENASAGTNTITVA